jgi:PhnB protein
MAVKPIPDGYHTVTPYIIVKGCAAALDWYKRAFGAEERYRCPLPDGRIGHAEIKIGDSIMMLADEMPEWNAKSPQTLGGTPFGICLYVLDSDASFQRAVAAGATVERPIADQFYGDRSGTIIDPYGHKWTLSTHNREVSMEEIERAMKSFTGKGADGCS